MRICIIAPIYHPFAMGGRERYITTLVSELKEDYEVIILTTKSLNEDSDKGDSNIKIIKINPKNVGTFYEMLTDYSTKMNFKKLIWHLIDIWNITSYFQIKKILHTEKPDLVFINGIRGLSSSVFSAIKQSKIPQIYMMHDFEFISRWSDLYRNSQIITKFNFLEKLYINFMRKKTSNINTVISPSNFLMDFHLKHGFFKTSKKFIVPNGTKLDDNPMVREGIGKEFLFLGQVVEHKGPQIAVQAFKKIKDRNLKLHVVGRGPYSEELKKIVDNDERIKIYGFVKDEHLKEIFDRCSYAIFPSIWYENYPLVIYEVMSKGIPVIASNIGGIPEQIEDGFNGFLFPPEDVDSLVEIIEKVSNDESILNSLSKNSISTSSKFKLENQINSLRNIFDQTNQR